MRARCPTWWLAAVPLAALAAGSCSRAGPARAPRDAGTLLRQADGAPVVGYGWTAGVATGATDPTLRKCRVAMHRPDWGPGGTLGSMQLQLRTFRAAGSRAQVLQYAHTQLCQQNNIPPERCTDDLFYKEVEWCDGDPPPVRSHDPRVQRLADQIQERLATSDASGGGVAAAPDAGAAPPPAPDAGPTMY